MDTVVQIIMELSSGTNFKLYKIEIRFKKCDPPVYIVLVRIGLLFIRATDPRCHRKYRRMSFSRWLMPRVISLSLDRRT